MSSILCLVAQMRVSRVAQNKRFVVGTGGKNIPDLIRSRSLSQNYRGHIFFDKS